MDLYESWLERRIKEVGKLLDEHSEYIYYRGLEEAYEEALKKYKELKNKK